MVDEEIPPDNVERFECLEKAEKRYINVTNYYYLCSIVNNIWAHAFFFFFFFFIFYFFYFFINNKHFRNLGCTLIWVIKHKRLSELIRYFF